MRRQPPAIVGLRDEQAPVISADGALLVVLDELVPVLLGLDPDQLAAGGVLARCVRGNVRGMVDLLS